MLAALNILSLVWLGLTWYKSGFLAALNVFLFSVLASFATLQIFAERGGM